MVTVRDLQFWFKPELSEEQIVEKQMIEIMINLRQMKMTEEARESREQYEREKAEALAKAKNAGK